MKIKATFTLQSDWTEHTIRVTAKYYQGQQGSRSALGVPMEPDDDPEMEIQSFSVDGQEIEIDLLSRIEDETTAFEDVADKFHMTAAQLYERCEEELIDQMDAEPVELLC